jgi:hypothetical protein
MITIGTYVVLCAVVAVTSGEIVMQLREHDEQLARRIAVEHGLLFDRAVG